MRIRNNYFVYQFIILLTVFLLFIPFSQSLAGSDHDTERLLTIDPDKQFEFAEYYFLNKEYSMAVSEYKRFIYFFPEDEKVEPAMHRIGMSYYYGKRFTKAIDSFKALIDRYGESDLSVKSYLMISESYLKIDNGRAKRIKLHHWKLPLQRLDIRRDSVARIRTEPIPIPLHFQDNGRCVFVRDIALVFYGEEFRLEHRVD